MRRLFVAAVFTATSIVVVADANAQERASGDVLSLTPALTAAFAQPLPAEPVQLDRSVLVPARSDWSGKTLGSLYVATAVMQGLDVHSTLRALDRGATEANPLMAGVTGNRAAFIATKAAVATATIFAARHMAKRNKVAAALTLVAINAAYIMVARHNYRVASSLR
jgi:hypothetical protein